MLKKITIDNFKSLKHLEYDCAGLNLLTGVNGAGKSSLIQFLLVLKSLPEMVDKIVDEACVGSWNTGARDYGDIHYRYTNELVRYNVSYLLKGVGREETISRCLGAKNAESTKVVVAQYPAFERSIDDRIKAGNDESDILARIVGDTTHPGERLENMYEANFQAGLFFGDEHAYVVPQDEINRYLGFKNLIQRIKYVSAFRGSPADIQDGSRLMLGGFSSYQLDPEGKDVFAFINDNGEKVKLFQGDLRIFPSSELSHKITFVGSQKGRDMYYTTLGEQIEMWLSTISPGAKLKLRDVRIGGECWIETKVAYGSSSDVECAFKPQNVGFGVSYSLPVIVALLTSGEGDVVIIENPEAHLHPRGQAEMGNLIARAVASGVQVFVETHSDHVINGVRVAVKKGIVKPEDVNIAFFERGPHDVPQEDGTTQHEIYSEVTNIKVDANGSLSEWPKDFMDEWGIQQMKLLRP